MAITKLFQLALIFVATIVQVDAHIAAWSKGACAPRHICMRTVDLMSLVPSGMYCLNGTTPGVDNGNNNSPVNPLFKLKKKDWWMHHVDKVGYCFA